MEDNFPVELLDCRGKYCPTPVAWTSDRVGDLQTGQVLVIWGDDPGMQIDIPAWCASNGHTFLGVQKEGGFFVFTIRVVKS